MQKAHKADAQMALTLQTVCKAWREAFLEYFASIDSAEISVPNSNAVPGVCKMLPGLSCLSASSHVSFSLQSLSACSRLSGLCLSSQRPRSAQIPLFDLSALPTGIQKLRIDGFKVDPTDVKLGQCSQLRHLVFDWEEAPEYEIADLLKHLPNLEVSISVCSTTIMPLQQL